MTDNVSAPGHYTRLNPEPLAVLGSWNLPYCRSQALKYVARAGHKNDEKEDIQKAIFYLRAELAKLNGDTEAFEALAGFLDGERDEPEQEPTWTIWKPLTWGNVIAALAKGTPVRAGCFDAELVEGVVGVVDRNGSWCELKGEFHNYSWEILQ